MYQIHDLPVPALRCIVSNLADDPRIFINYLKASPDCFREFCNSPVWWYNNMRKKNRLLKDVRFSTSPSENWRILRRSVMDIPRQIIISRGGRYLEWLTGLAFYSSSDDQNAAKFWAYGQLKKAGFGKISAEYAARDLSIAQVQNALKLKREEVTDAFSKSAAKNLTDSQIQNMIKLKREGVTDAFSESAAKNLTDSQIQNMIKLKREGVTDAFSESAATKLTDPQMQNMIKLKRAGVSDAFSESAAKNLTDPQIQVMTKFKREGMTCCSSYLKARNT